MAYALDAAERLLDEGKRGETRVAYRQTLTAARSLHQINIAADRLRELGEDVDLPATSGS